MAVQSTSCKILFLILSVFVYSIVAQYNCKDFASESWRNFTINETFEGILESVYISDIEDAEIQSSAHLQASVNADKFLTVSVKTNFEDHDEDIDTTAKLVIDCANHDYTIDYYLNIGREACTELDFSRDYYTYIAYNGLPQDFVFVSNDFERVSIKCARNSIKLNIEENDYIEAYTAGDQGSNGGYYFGIRTKKEITAPFDQIFNITAVDTEDPENFATAFLEVDISESEEMYFEESDYSGVIYRDLKIVINNGPIVLLDSLSDLNMMEILPDYGDFFDVKLSSGDVELVVSPQRKYEELNDTSVIIMLVAHDTYYKYIATTFVMLNVSPEILTTEAGIVENAPTISASQGENNEETDDSENHETNDEGDAENGSQQTGDDNEDIDSQEDNKQTNDKDNDSQQNDEDEDQKVDVDQKVDDNDEDKQIDDYDEDQKVDDDEDDQKGGDDDEDQKSDDDKDDDYNDDDGLVLEGGIVNIDVPLTGLDYWIAQTRAITVIIVVICSFIIVSLIIYLRNRTPRREIYMY